MNQLRPNLQDGQEWVWDYPRPPQLESLKHRVRVLFSGAVIADSLQAWRVLETSHPPTIYIPREDVTCKYLQAASGASWCEWKGRAEYFSLDVNGQKSQNAGWFYAQPTVEFAQIAGYLAFYPSRVDECWVGDERVQAQAGDFYGGWIWSQIVGPFKGAPGTLGW